MLKLKPRKPKCVNPRIPENNVTDGSEQKRECLKLRIDKQY